jgi:hypothetical protein
VTVAEKHRFAQCFNRLAVAVRLPADEADAAMKQIYWDGLQDLPVEAVEDAARQLQLGEWFPKLGEWRDVAEKAKNARILTKALPSPDRGAWVSECATCDDTGWEPLECQGGITGMCGRQREHPAHPYAVACACRMTNHTYQRKKAYERERRGSKERD